MSNEIDKIRDAMHEFEQTPESAGLDLRLSLTEIIVRKLRQKRWSQRQLAHKTHLKESYISRVLHSNANWTSDTAGKLLHALGIRAQLSEQPTIARPFKGHTKFETKIRLIEASDGEKISQTEFPNPDQPIKAAG